MPIDPTAVDALQQLTSAGINQLAEKDPLLFELIYREYERQSTTLSFIAASSFASPDVLSCSGSVFGNLTTEGYPKQRYHSGCDIADALEELAIERARTAFKARYANVQPHSGSGANQILFFSLLKPGDTVLGLDLVCGGHLTHGAPASVSGKYFKSIAYGLDESGLIDYGQVRELARMHRPKIIVCGASAYPRVIDFERFRDIADELAWIIREG